MSITSDIQKQYQDVYQFLLKQDEIKLAKKVRKSCLKKHDFDVSKPVSSTSSNENVVNANDTKSSSSVSVPVLEERKRKTSESQSEDLNPIDASATAVDSLKQAAKKIKQRFQRVDPKDVQFVDDRLKDNTFLAKGGATQNSYGYKANEDLSKVRGKGFTKSKNKMKKGSYRGGAIDTKTHSIKFSTSSDEE
ncbi:hypothetical protein MIR68_012542 [Amoeboaphelidium protococcarum]|nr:hypothetical protein MIR68_012542 [Amoeboaphelidium protococcarum]